MEVTPLLVEEQPQDTVEEPQLNQASPQIQLPLLLVPTPAPWGRFLNLSTPPLAGSPWDERQQHRRHLWSLWRPSPLKIENSSGT